MKRLGDFAEMTETEVLKHIVEAYDVRPEVLAQDTILIAYEDEGSYEGSSWFLLRNNASGDLRAVYGGHCSCYGFEGQWAPETSDVDSLDKHYNPAGDDGKRAIQDLVSEGAL